MRTLDPVNKKYFRYATNEIGKDSEVDIQAKCVICGDSETNSKQMRLHLYTKPQYEDDICHCFNCGWKGNMYQFLQEVNPTLYDEYKKEKRETSFNSLKKKKDEYDSGIIEIGNYSHKRIKQSIEENRNEYDSGNDDTEGMYETDSTETLKGKSIPEEVFELPEEFFKASDSFKASEYLRGRNLDPNDYYFSKTWIKHKGKDIPVKNCIIIPLWVNESERIVFGFQARSIESKFFYTYIPPENSGYKVWNWYGIDRKLPTFIFEGTFDALSSGLPRNCISAALGSDLIQERADELSEVIYCFDNQRHDNTSKVKSIELLKKGKRVFIWPTGLTSKDANEFICTEGTPNDMAKMILKNVYSGMEGIMKLKLGK